MTNNVENLSPEVLRAVMKEMRALVTNTPEGIKVHVNDDDVTDIQATVEGPAGTPYHHGMFKVRLALGKDFPQTPPKAYFLTKIFHPNVSSSGEICVNTLKKDWKADLGIKHILLTVKCLLIVPNAESALNEEAGKLLLEHYDEYCERARMMTSIHALPRAAKHSDDAAGLVYDDESTGPLAKKHASDSNCPAKGANDKKKVLKDKKRTLKRL